MLLVIVRWRVPRENSKKQFEVWREMMVFFTFTKEGSTEENWMFVDEYRDRAGYDKWMRTVPFYEALRNINPSHAASICAGHEGVFHGMLTYLLQDVDGQIQATHSISAGLDYPGVGPEHAFLHATKRVHYAAVRDEAALNAFKQLSLSEGIIPALESAHALAYATTLAKRMKRNSVIVVTLSGRGDKDVQVVAEAMGDEV